MFRQTRLENAELLTGECGWLVNGKYM